MDAGSQEEREVRAVRNQALFRAVNEKMRSLNDSLTSLTDFAIACECADTSCTEMIEIDSDEYLVVRAESRRFAVLPGHVYPDVETVVRELEQYVVVEKTVSGAEAAAILGGTDGKRG